MARSLVDLPCEWNSSWVLIMMWPVRPLCFWEDRSQESWPCVSQRGGTEACCKCCVVAQVLQQLLLSGYGRAVDLALGAGARSSLGLLTPVGVCVVTFDHIGELLSCVGFVDTSISCHLHRNCSPCADSFAKCCSLALELTTALGQSRCPIVKRKVVTAEGGQVLYLLLSWRSTCSFIFLVVPVAPRAVWRPGLAPGHVARRLQVPSAPREAGGMEGRQFALEIRKETVFSGR